MSPRPRIPSALPPAQLRPLRNRLRLSVRDAGLTDLSPADLHGKEAFWELEPTPLILAPEEWAVLEAAIRQRTRLINAFLSDLYHRQEVLRAGLVPPEVTLGDPYYRRPCLGLHPERSDPATLIRFDLVKTSAGWHFTETHTNAPVGLSYAIQNRRFLTQEAGDFYRALPDYRSIINFPLEVVDALRALAPRGLRRPSMVFLTAGPRYPFYSEHSFLARKMGLRLAQGDDLLVLDNHVYFKTVAGLEQVDVIYRRLHDSYIDPVVFSTDRESAGIPGLMQCIRAGTVVMANAIGVGVAENRALHAYLPRLARYFFNERLLLPSIPTYVCTDTDQIDLILDQAEHLHLLPTHAPRADEPPVAPLSLRGRALPRAVRENPQAFVAQPHLTSLSLPGRGRRPTPFRLSTYALTRGDQVSVLPGGIINLGPGEYPTDRVGVSADVIVLAGDAATAGRLSDFETNVSAGAESTVPSSRAAESLFWLGRYLERAETTARMLHILDDVALEEIPPADRRRWLPLWRGLLEATGHADQKISARVDPRTTLTADLLWRMTLGRQHPSSLLRAVGAATANARELREFVSPEAGSVLTRLEDTLLNLARQAPTERHAQARAARLRAGSAAIAAVLAEVNACLGAATRTMLHDAGWHFVQIGLQLERATVTTGTLRHVLAPTPTGGTPVPEAALLYRDNPELSALLRMLGSQDAYRRLFRTRSQPLFVAQLFLQQPQAPRSILHNLRQIAHSLASIRDATGAAPDSFEVGRFTQSMLEELTALNLGVHFDPDAQAERRDTPTLDERLNRLLDRLGDLHTLLGDHYFSHQARLDSPALQAELRLDPPAQR